MWRSTQFPFAGGLNEEDPQFTQKPGSIAFVRNYECLPGGGYRRCKGYDRFAGGVGEYLPYQKVAFTNGQTEPTVGEEIVFWDGADFTDSGFLIGYSLESGRWSDGTAAGTIGCLLLAGTFTIGDTILENSTGAVIGTSASAIGDPEISDAFYKEFTANANELERNFAPAVTGQGPVLGGFVLNGDVFAWRADATDSTIQNLWSPSGGTWSQIPIAPYLPFDDGTAEIADGDTVTGGTSGATGTARMVNIAEGNYAGPTFAAGRIFIVDTSGGPWQDDEEIRVGGVKKALVNGTLTTPTASSGTMLARHQTVTTNFFGASDLIRTYGCDGYNDPYVCDGEYVMYFSNTMATFPRYIEAHRNHLFLAYPGGSIQNSGTGLPLTWSVRTGAAEIGIGDDPTGMRSNGNNTLAITADKSVNILVGTSDLDWNLRVITDEVGCISNTVQDQSGQTLFMDRSGINVLLPAPPTYQDYSTQQISRNVRKTIEAQALGAVCSLSVPSLSQYRVFFDDKSVLLATFFGSKLMGWSKFQYAHQATCAFSGTVSDELHYFMGTDDGYVMQLEFGGSFAGEKIESILQLPFCYHKYPDRDKRFHKITLEMETERTIDLRFHLDFDYGTGIQTANFVTSTGATGGLWDFANWENFFWDSGVLTAPEVNIDGVGRNIGITFYHNDDIDPSFTLSAMLLQFSLYGIKR